MSVGRLRRLDCTDATIAYEVVPWACECHAGQLGDPVCKHRAALLARLGRLTLDPDPARAAPVSGPVPEIPCHTCGGYG